MPRTEPAKLWWTPAELAASGLPTLPGSVRGINALVEAGNWRAVPEASRKRAGRGGGWEYHWSVLPFETHRVLLMDDQSCDDAPRDRGTAWAEFDQLPDVTKGIAEARLDVLAKVETLHRAGVAHVSAVSTLARQVGKSDRTIYNWFKMVNGVAVEDRLPYLAPRHKLAKRTATSRANYRPFMDHLKSDFLRFEGPNFTSSYRDAAAEAKAQGWEIPNKRTAERRLHAEVPRVTQVFTREGETGLMKCFPAQIRDRSGMVAMEGVNADCHKIDVFVEWDDGTINRPQVVAFQDLYSGKILSWRVDHDPNKVMVMAAFGEMIENWGIPRHCLFDNGREFANKWLTAGTPTRFRFQIRDSDPLGVLPLLGIKVHWATPGHGQAKPIERSFGGFASDIAKDARFHGAYVGNSPLAKPENYRSRAVSQEVFLKVLAEGIAEHNAREGRLSPTCQGRSFDATFADSYARAAIQKATEEQRRLWMMGQHVGTLHQQNGSLGFQKNVYHAPWMSQHTGLRVVARFDPEDLHSGVHLYRPDGGYLGFAECQQKVGFFDIAGARRSARRRADILKTERKLADLHKPHTVEEIASRKDARATEQTEDLDAKVVAPVFRTKMPNRPVVEQPKTDPAVEAHREAMIVQMADHTRATPEPKDSDADRFWRARDILDRSERGQPMGTEEARWVAEYIETPQYRAALRMFEAFGASGVK